MNSPSVPSASPPRKTDEFPSASKQPATAKVKKTPVAKVPCTPFCDSKIPCPKHHDLIVSLMNCNDHLGPKSNLLAFQQCVKRCINDGWDKDDIVPDESEDLRFPLVHLACAFAKCSALDWLIEYGFDPHVKSETTGQFALQRGIVGICRARHKGTHKELIPKIKRFITKLKKQLMFHDDVNGDTPLHTAAAMLTSVDLKPQFFEGCIEVIVKEAFKMEYPARTILDAINNEGRTALHVLASSTRKVEYCASAIRTLVLAGADKSIRDNDGQTALDIAFAGGVQNIVDELLKVHSGYGVTRAPEVDHDLDYNVHPNMYPSPSLTDDCDSNWNELPNSCSSSILSNDDFPTMTSLGSIKCERGNERSSSITSYTYQNGDSDVSSIGSTSPAVLKYLGDAGLLSDVSALVARARAQDEANMRKLQNQAKEFEEQIKNKERCIDKMKEELATLRKKRKECDSDFAKLTKRIHSCENAMKALPNL